MKVKKQRTEGEKKELKQKIIKGVFVLAVLAIIFVGVYLILKFTGTLEKIDSAEELKKLILKGGVWSYFIFIFLQFLQVTFLPIPAIVTTLAGTWVFGPWVCAFLSLVAILLGSLFAFFLGRKVGFRIIKWVAGESDAKKYAQKLEKGKYVFFLMMIFPIFPDDILCMIAGTTNMSYKFFIGTNLISRPIAIFSTCFLGSGTLIPFHGWGIPVWAVIIILGALLFYLSIKYQSKIEKFTMELGSKISFKLKSWVGYEDPELELFKAEQKKNKKFEIHQKKLIKNFKIEYEKLKKKKVGKKEVVFGIVKMKKQDNVIGEIAYNLGKNFDTDSLEITCKIVEQERNKGYMTQFLKQFLEDVNESKIINENAKEIKQVVCVVSPSNIQSVKVLTKCGFLPKTNQSNVYFYPV